MAGRDGRGKGVLVYRKLQLFLIIQSKQVRFSEKPSRHVKALTMRGGNKKGYSVQGLLINGQSYFFSADQTT